MKLIIIICLALIALAAAVPTPKVVNGTDATIEEFPFMVSLRRPLSHSCGGTILNKWWILTAAHCAGGAPSAYTVQFASTEISTMSPRVVGVAEVHRHEYYNASNQYIHDIALFKLNQSIENSLFDYKVKLPAPGSFYPTGTPAVLAGWGYNATGGVVQTTLQKVDLQIYSASDCDLLHNTRTLHPTNICGGVDGGWQGQCSDKSFYQVFFCKIYYFNYYFHSTRDSGGPLLVSGVQVGIVSWSIKPCTVPPYPGVYTAVAPYIDWIQSKTGLNFHLNMFVQA